MTKPVKKEEKLPDFDPNLSPYNPQNVDAAEKRGLRYNTRRQAYEDEDGYIVRDQFGQPL